MPAPVLVVWANSVPVVTPVPMNSALEFGPFGGTGWQLTRGTGAVPGRRARHLLIRRREAVDEGVRRARRLLDLPLPRLDAAAVRKHGRREVLALDRAVGDIDNDGFPNHHDSCPFHADPTRADVDDDGVGDLCDHCPDTPDNDDVDPARLRGTSGAHERPGGMSPPRNASSPN